MAVASDNTLTVQLRPLSLDKCHDDADAVFLARLREKGLTLIGE